MSNLDVQWLEQQVRAYGSELEPFKTYAKVLPEILRHAAKPLCESAIVDARAKAIPSVARKLVRQYETLKNHSRPLEELTDLCGARVILQLQSQVDAMSAFVVSHFDIDIKNSQDTRERLAADQFGYLSIHYIVQIDPSKLERLGLLSAKGPITRDELAQIGRRKAEIQLRTIAQHAWADTGHNRIYKADFKLPLAFQRRNAKVAALLEEVDGALAELVDGIDDLFANVRAYRTPDETRNDIEQLEAVLTHDPQNVSLIADIARRQISVDLCRAAAATVDKYPRTPLPVELLACKGRALCIGAIEEPHGDAYREGRRLLADACRRDPRHLEAAIYLAESSVPIERDDALAQFERAFEIDANNPVALGGYLRHRLADDRHPRALRLLSPNIRAAARRCREQIAARVNLPHALFHLAEFELLLQPFESPDKLDHAYQGLYALCRAISLNAHNPKLLQMVAAQFDLLARLEHAPWLGWAKQTVLLAQAAAGGAMALTTSPEFSPIKGPVLLIAGGCDAESERRIVDYQRALEAILGDFKGTVICGGTKEGISGLTGRLCAQRGLAIHAIGYLPARLPSDNSAHRDDEHYRDIRRSKGIDGFSPEEPLQAWADLLGSGIKPADVTLVGINGGDIAGFEYHLAAAIGAKVAIVNDSGRRADILMLERDQPGNEKIYFFPDDPETFRAIIGYPPKSPFDEKEVINLAAEVDRTYHQAEHQLTVEHWRNNLAKDEKLAASFNRSNRMQVEHIPEKLARIGKKAVKASGRAPQLASLSPSEIARLAEMEHGRWVVERTWDGWKWGRTRDNAKRERPQLVSWDDLEESEREKDLEAVRAIPRLLASIGYEIVPVG